MVIVLSYLSVHWFFILSVFLLISLTELYIFIIIFFSFIGVFFTSSITLLRLSISLLRLSFFFLFVSGVCIITIDNIFKIIAALKSLSDYILTSLSSWHWALDFFHSVWVFLVLSISNFSIRIWTFSYYVQILWILFKPSILTGFLWYCSGKGKGWCHLILAGGGIMPSPIPNLC